MNEHITDNKKKAFRPGSKAVIAVLIFLFVVGIFSFIIMYPYNKLYSNSNNYDLAIIGASEAEWGVDPAILDAELGTKSIVLGASGATLDARYDFIKSAIQQDSLKTVVLDVSCYALVKNMTSFPLDHKVIYIARLSGFSNKLKAASEQLSFFEDEYDALYGELILHGAMTWQSILTGNSDEVYSSRGYERQFSSDQSISKDDAASLLNSESLKKIRTANVERLKDMLALLNEYDINVIVASFPLPESYVWKNDGWDDFREAMLDAVKDYDCSYYDFNLLENRSQYFNDTDSFRDNEHLSGTGAEIFTGILSDIIDSEINGAENNYSFYDNYEEAKDHSVYSQIS